MDESHTLFNSYKTEFEHIIASVRDQLETSGKDADAVCHLRHHLQPPPTSRPESTLRHVEMHLDEADDLVSQMEIEFQGIPPSARAQHRDSLHHAKAELARYKKLASETRAQLARAELLRSSTHQPPAYDSDVPYETAGDRARLLAGTALLESGAKRLQESHRIALETENQGATILSNLRQQRDQIEHSRSTLYRADAAVDRASGTLKKMVIRMYQQRAITTAIVGILILLIVIIVWEKFS